MRIAICDDEREDIKHLADFFDAHLGYDVDWEPYPNGEKLVADYTRGERYDALFIDMEMDDMNGIETAKAVRALDRRVVIIFVTSHRKYMQESFDCLPLQFIVKPASQKELEKALRTIQKRLDEERVAINFYDNKRPIRLYCDEILYCESKHIGLNCTRRKKPIACAEQWQSWRQHWHRECSCARTRRFLSI